MGCKEQGIVNGRRSIIKNMIKSTKSICFFTEPFTLNNILWGKVKHISTTYSSVAKFCLTAINPVTFIAGFGYTGVSFYYFLISASKVRQMLIAFICK